MKKLVTLALFALVATACAPVENSNTMDKGMMCEKCTCCQEMMNKGVQCPIIGEKKDGMSCCCKKMMEGMGTKRDQKVSMPVDHKAHH